MVDQFKHTRVDGLMNDLVEENGWLDRGKTEVRLLCGFGPPLILQDVQEFRPKNGGIQSRIWRRHNPNSVETVPTLPLGIAQSNFWAKGDVLDDLEQHLDEVIRNKNDLDEFADRVLRMNRHNQSSRTVKALLEWYQEWRDQESVSSSLLGRTV